MSLDNDINEEEQEQLSRRKILTIGGTAAAGIATGGIIHHFWPSAEEDIAKALRPKSAHADWMDNLEAATGADLLKEEKTRYYIPNKAFWHETQTALPRSDLDYTKNRSSLLISLENKPQQVHMHHTNYKTTFAGKYEKERVTKAVLAAFYKEDSIPRSSLNLKATTNKHDKPISLAKARFSSLDNGKETVFRITSNKKGKEQPFTTKKLAPRDITASEQNQIDCIARKTHYREAKGVRAVIYLCEFDNPELSVESLDLDLNTTGLLGRGIVKPYIALATKQEPALTEPIRY